MLLKISTSQDYDPFGMLMPTRTWDAESSYRFGFQGQERDDEIKGAGNSLNYTYRMHDPRLGRFFAVDPLSSEYPWNSPFAFSENRVLDGIELEGLEYLDAKTAKVRIINGVAAINLDNVSNPTLNAFKSNPKASQIIDKLDFSKTKRENKPGIGEMELKTLGVKESVRITLNSKQAKEIGKGKNYKTISLSNGQIKSKSEVFVSAIIFLSESIQNTMIEHDYNEIISQAQLVEKSLSNLNTALNENCIPSEFLDKGSLSNIANVILTGKLSDPLKDGEVHNYQVDGEWKAMDAKEYNSKVSALGIEIFNNSKSEDNTQQ